MNRLLILVIIILIPVTIVTDKKETTTVGYEVTLEKKNMELEIEDSLKEELNQVLVSNNKDKSDAYYIPLEEYVIGVVAGEMPASFEMEALKAQAVAARTYALYKQKNIDGYVLSTTINDQVYLSKEQMQQKWGKDFDHYYERVKEAVLNTAGEVVTYNDKLIIAYYFAISNGYTENALNVFNENKEYLVSVDSKWDKNYKSYVSTRTMDKNTFCERLGINGNTINISNVIRGDNNYVRNITINNKTFTGKEIFNKLGLKSTDFTIMVNGNDVIIKTLGFGHGVGMSQYGAQGMAKEGKTYKDILTYYYQNTEITNI